MKWLPLVVLILLASFFLLFREKTEKFQIVFLQEIAQTVVSDPLLTPFHKEKISGMLEKLQSQSSIIEEGDDEQRVKFVFLQGCVERILTKLYAQNKIKHLLAIIHAPMPPTPLCTEASETDLTLLAPGIRYDLDKLLTVSSRAGVVRQYLAIGGTLYCAYPKAGLEKRSETQRAIYKQALETYPNHLFPYELNIDTFDAEMIGAIYFFQTQSKQPYICAVKTRQANEDPQSISEWGVWIGPFEDTQIKAHVSKILDYLQKSSGKTFPSIAALL